MNAAYIPNRFDVIIEHLIDVEILVIFGMGAFTFLLIVARRIGAKNSGRIRKKIDRFITEQICLLNDGKPKKVKYQFEFNWLFHRRVVQEELLEQLVLFTGIERNYIIELYRRLGFEKYDVARCHSPFWWIRLQSLIHLDHSHSPTLAPLFHRMIQDRTPLISIAAILALSSLDHALNHAGLVHELPEGIFNHRDALNEVLINLGTQHGPHVLIDCLKENKKSPLNLSLIESCVRALSQMKPLEAVTPLMDLLKRIRHPGSLQRPKIQDDHAQINVISESIHALSMIEDPKCCPSIRPFLRHPNPRIQAEAALLLIHLNDEVSMRRLQDFEKSTSVEVRQIIQHHRNKQKAAA